VDELRLRAGEELDYVHEAQAQRAVAAAFAGSSEYAVPDVVAAADGVLVSEWLPGRPLVTVAGDTEDERRRVALLYQRFALLAPARAGWLHADPHPGNFRVTPDGRLGVVDFGAVVAMPDGLPPAFGRLVRAFADESAPGDAQAALVAAGLVRPGRRVDIESLRAVMSPFSEPARHDLFAFSSSWLRSCFARDEAARDPDYTAAMGLTLPAEHLMTPSFASCCPGSTDLNTEPDQPFLWVRHHPRHRARQDWRELVSQERGHRSGHRNLRKALPSREPGEHDHAVDPRKPAG
jgi:hypothetical protein